MSNAKNYKEQGGDKWVVKGTLEISEGGQFLLAGKEFKRASAQTNSEAATILELKSDLNALLTKLRAAGLIAT